MCEKYQKSNESKIVSQDEFLRLLEEDKILRTAKSQLEKELLIHENKKKQRENHSDSAAKRIAQKYRELTPENNAEKETRENYTLRVQGRKSSYDVQVIRKYRR